MQEHSLRPMTNADLEQVLQWRNHPEVRNYMYTTHEIHPEEHRNWFKNSKTNPSIELLIYERAGRAQGFVNITRTRFPEVADWGFYLAPDAMKGGGQALGEQALNYAFAELNIHKVCGQVVGNNDRSISFHKKLGFVEEGRLRQQHCIGDKFFDVVCFGILKADWQFEDGT